MYLNLLELDWSC